MLLGRVQEPVVSTAKLQSLSGRTLLLVEIVSVRAHGLVGTGRRMLCVDAVGAGRGELVLVVQGSSSRIAPDMAQVPTDAVVVGIIDALSALGQHLEMAE